MSGAADDPRTAETLRWLEQTVTAAELVAGGSVSIGHPRDLVAARIRGVVAAFDREHGWPSGGGETGEHTLRVRALRVADTLAQQGQRARTVAR